MDNRCFNQAIRIAAFIAIVLGSCLLANEMSDKKELLDLDIEQLVEVEVTSASKQVESIYEAPGIMVVVPQDEIETYGDRNLHQLLQRQPSIYTRDAFVYSDNMVGFRGDMSSLSDLHTLILFNGRPIRESAQGINVNLYKTFPLSVLGSVELIRGPGSALYGSNAFTGVINLMPRIPDTNEISISSIVGRYDYYTSAFTAGGRSGDLGYITAFQVTGTQGYPYKLTGQLGTYGTDEKSFKSYSAAAHLEYKEFSFDFFGSDLDAFSMGVTPWWSNPRKQFRNKKYFFNAGYRKRLHEKVEFEFNLTYNFQENSLTSYNPQMIGTNTSDILGEATLYIKPIDKMNIVLGYLMEQRSNYHPDSGKFQSINAYRHEPKSFYAQGDYKIGKIVKLISGLQWNRSSQGIADLISRFGIIITPNDNWGVKLLRGEAFRAPVTIETDLYDPPILVGNKDIKPESITTYDAQLFYHDKKTYAAVTYFNSTIDQMITYDYSVAPTSYQNSGKQRFQGIEFEAKHSLTDNLQVIGSFMHQENDDEVGVNPTVVPENMLKIGTSYDWGWGSLSAFLTHFGEPPHIFDSVISNPKPEPVSLISMNLSVDVSKWLGLKEAKSTFTFKVENLCDDDVYAPTFAYTGSPNSFPYNAGRTFYAGIKITF
jgi:outer membrane receptor protein involved in Fe transport